MRTRRAWPRGRGGASSRAAAAAAAVLLATVACGGGSEEQPQQQRDPVSVEDDGTQVIDLRETDGYRFSPDDPRVRPGKVRIDMTNTSTTTTHSLAFKPGGPAEEIPFVNPDETRSISFVVDVPGEYPFFCTFHEQLGQRGTLTVEEP